MELVQRFFKFVIPSIISMWIFSLYTMVDGIFVARGVGEHALAAVNLSMPYIAVIFTVGILFATGTSTVISVALGRGGVEEARNFFNQNLCVVGGVSLLFTVLTLVNLEWVCLFLGATDNTLGYVKEYVGTIAMFFPFFTVSYNLEVQVKANGAPHVSTIGVLSCALMNVVLDYVFVMWFHWGVSGAAFATGLAQMTSMSVFFVYFLTHREKLRFQRFRPHLADYRRILPLGLSDGLTELANGIVIFAFNHVILAVIGEKAVISYTIISYVNTLVLMTMTGTAQGIQPLVSFHLGAGQRSACHRLLVYGLGLIAVFSLVSFAICQLLPEPIVGMFLTAKDGALVDYSIAALRMYSCTFLVFGFNVILAGFFTAVEKPVYSVVISFGRGLVLMLGSLLFLSAVFGEGGIWFSTLLSEVLCLFVSAYFLARYVRGERQRVGADSDPVLGSKGGGTLGNGR